MFAMFKESDGKTRLCLRFTKDEKGKGDTPQERYSNQQQGSSELYRLSCKGVKSHFTKISKVLSIRTVFCSAWRLSLFEP
jgi:hypothetical protein